MQEVKKYKESLRRHNREYPVSYTHLDVYKRQEKQLSGKGGAILTIRAGSKERAYKLINHLKYVKIVTNIGDVRTLVIHPASTIYIHSTPEAMAEAGVYDDKLCIRDSMQAFRDRPGSL